MFSIISSALLASTNPDLETIPEKVNYEYVNFLCEMCSIIITQAK